MCVCVIVVGWFGLLQGLAVENPKSFEFSGYRFESNRMHGRHWCSCELVFV